jgi:hypothetical protein
MTKNDIIGRIERVRQSQLFSEEALPQPVEDTEFRLQGFCCGCEIVKTITVTTAYRTPKIPGYPAAGHLGASMASISSNKSS